MRKRYAGLENMKIYRSSSNLKEEERTWEKVMR